jgi:hypothetical protein
MPRQLKLSKSDEKIANKVIAEIHKAYERAHRPVVVVKRIASVATRYRNIGRLAAIRRHPFRGVCESSGRRLARKDARLDELTPAGHFGKVRWVCDKANNSGRRSCGKC